MGDTPDTHDDIEVGTPHGSGANWSWMRPDPAAEQATQQDTEPIPVIKDDSPKGNVGQPAATSDERPAEPEDETATTTNLRSVKPPQAALIDEGLMPPPGRIHVLWCYLRFAVEYILQWSLRNQFNGLGERIQANLKQKIYAVHNTKGGSGKSALSSWLFGELGGVINRPLIAFDCNAGAGSTTSRFGISRSKTIWLREYLQLCKEGKMSEAEDFLSFVGWHNESGVSVIASDPDNDNPITQKDMLRGLGIAKAHSYSVICDLGNQIKNASSKIPLRMAHALIFVGNVNMANSLPDLQNTRVRVAAAQGPREKVKAGIIVIIGAKLKDRAKYADQFDVPIGQLFVIPNNRYMKKGRPVKLIMLPLRIRVILRQILVAAMEAPVFAEETLEYRQRIEPSEFSTKPGLPRGLDDIEVFVGDGQEVKDVPDDEDEEDETGPQPDQTSILDN